jgi:hypothetical protein
MSLQNFITNGNHYLVIVKLTEVFYTFVLFIY